MVCVSFRLLFPISHVSSVAIKIANRDFESEGVCAEDRRHEPEGVSCSPLQLDLSYCIWEELQAVSVTCTVHLIYKGVAQQVPHRHAMP